MNCIQCKNCYDILAPVERAGVRICACGNIQMRAVPVAEIGHNNLVEVKIFDSYRINSFGSVFEKEVKQVYEHHNLFAQVVKIHNHYLKGDHGLHEWLLDEPNERESLFYKNRSQIVIAPMDTPGVKVVDEWSNKSLQTTEEYLKSVDKTKRYKQIA